LIVNANAVLSCPTPYQRFQLISWWLPKIPQFSGRLYSVEFPPSDALYAAPSGVRPELSQFGRIVVFKAPYHNEDYAPFRVLRKA
jgi:hypothetical protein